MKCLFFYNKVHVGTYFFGQNGQSVNLNRFFVTIIYDKLKCLSVFCNIINFISVV